MAPERKKQYILGGTAAIGVLIFIIMIFTLMSQTNLKEAPMDPGLEGMDWSYELISGSRARPAEPVAVDDFTVSFPGESCRAVRASRTIHEELPGANIGIYLYEAVCGVDILLDDEMIYTSFKGTERDESGFVITDGLEPSASEREMVALPEDYLGRKLTVVTYFPSETSEIVPLFPYLCSVDTMFSVTSVENVPPVARATLCAVFAFLTALVYVLDISNGKADKRILLLTLFYVMLTLDQAFSSIAGSYSLLTEKLNILDFIGELYIAPLLFFAAFSMTSWRRWTLTAATGAWFIVDLVKLIRFRILYGPFYGKASALIILLLYILALVMIIAEMKLKPERRPQKSDWVYVGIAALAAAGHVIMFSAEWEWDAGTYLQQIIADLLQGYFYPLVVIISYVCATVATAAVIIEFVKRTLRTRELVNVLAEQNRRAMDSYRQMAHSEEMTYSLRHEMRHHMVALAGMLQEGDTGRAREYVASVTAEYDELPEGQYSKNTMVNIIAGAYLSGAAASGIEVRHSFNLPETLPIADMDLCVFLTNMFENAVNACDKVGGMNNRYIHSKMYISGSYLFIGCENSAAPDGNETRKTRSHGYGLENMRRIAEKYGGILKIDRSASAFSVKSSFYLNYAGAREENGGDRDK